MSRPEIILLPLARRDLREIWRYIGKENSEFVADVVLTRIQSTLDVLAFAPFIGKRRDDFPGKPYSFPVRPYAIFYVPKPDQDGIVVWRVLHGARNLKRIVKRPKGKP
jgi:plasmid stabilization system protein ParE